jgi:hypothetical protein
MADAQVRIEKASFDELQKFLKEHPDLLKGKSFDVSIGPPPASSSGPTQAQVYDQMMQSIRQWGTTRYILFPLYITLTGVLTLAYYKNDTWIPSLQLAFAGLAATAAWFVFERSLSKSLKATWDEIAKIVKDVFPPGEQYPNPLAHRQDTLVKPARYTFYGIYLLTGLYWLALFVQELLSFRVCWQHC